MQNVLGHRWAALALVVLLPAALAACIPMTPAQAPAQQPAQQPAEQPVQVTPEGARIVSMIVGPELVDCTGVTPQKCYQVKASPEDKYQWFYSQIRGFEYKPGYEYLIRVKVEPVANPPADASAYTYTLLEVVSKTPSAGAGGAASATPAPKVSAAVETLAPEVAPAVETPETVDALQVAPVSGTSCVSESCASPVPGGRSTTR
jgi:hypothetical protein